MLGALAQAIIVKLHQLYTTEHGLPAVPQARSSRRTSGARRGGASTASSSTSASAPKCRCATWRSSCSSSSTTWSTSSESREAVEYVHTVLREGTSADRQLAVYQETGDLKAVVQHIVDETRAGVDRRDRGNEHECDERSTDARSACWSAASTAFRRRSSSAVNELGAPHGITAEMVTFGGTKMDEPARYRVIVDRISHEVEYYRGALKHAVLQGTYVINNPFWWTADDKFFNYSVMAKLGCAIPKTVLLPQKGYPKDIDLTPESLRNLEYPIDWDALLDYVGRPAILKPYSGGGWKHVYKVNDQQELLEAYDGTAPYCMTLQEFIDFDLYVRCFTFGKTDITPVALRPARAAVPRRSRLPVAGARRAGRARCADDQPGARLRDEHDRVRRAGRRAVRDRLPEPGARLRARSHHRFLLLARRREDGVARDRPRAQQRSVAVLAAVGGDARHRHGLRLRRRARRPDATALDGRRSTAWHALLRPDVELTPRVHGEFAAAMRARKLTFGDRVHCPFLRPFFLTRSGRSADAGRGGDASRRSASA